MRPDLENLRRLIDEGVIRVAIDHAFPLERIRDAFAAKERGHARGKIAIEIAA
jgi:NADPH:quinone reductase-like Zn-dependent oxidoreductase